MARDDAWTRPWSLVKRASFSTKAAPGSTMSAAAASSFITTPCTTRVGSVPARRASTIHEVSPSEPSGPGLRT